MPLRRSKLLGPLPLLLLLFSLPWCLVTRAGAQVSPNGPEFQVNIFTTSGQARPSMAFNEAGDFVVTWLSYGSTGTDASYSSIQARRYKGTGVPLSGEFQVNSYTTSRQIDPAIAVAGTGNFVVAWGSTGSSGTDNFYSIQGQRYDSTGAPLGAEFQINTYTTNAQFRPKVAIGGNGDFVVVWTSMGGSSGTDSYWSIEAQRYDGAGTAVGAEFQVNTYTTSRQKLPVVAADPQGNFVVAWSSYGSTGTDTNGYCVVARRYDGSGAPLGGEFQVNTYTTGTQYNVSMAGDGGGGFVIVWDSTLSSGTDTSSQSIHGQRYDSAGAIVGTEFQVNSYTTGNQFHPVVAARAAGDFVVSWSSLGSSGTDIQSASVQAQRYDSNGIAFGSQFQVNTFTTGDEGISEAVALDAQGNFIVAWQASGVSGGTDTLGFSVAAQRYDALFRDGFEIGTSRWSATTP